MKEETPNLPLLEHDKVFEVLGNIPKWITKSGAILFTLITIALFLCGYFIKYPDIVSASILMTTSNPPINLKSHVNGRIVKLFVENNQLVKKNALLAILENSANYKDVLKLKAELLSNNNLCETKAVIKTDLFDNNFILGELQGDYAKFLKSLNEYRGFCSSNSYTSLKVTINKTLSNYGYYYESLVAQKKIKMSELNIIEHQYVRDSISFQKHLISEKEFENSYLNRIAKKYDYESVNANIDNLQVLISQAESRLIENNNDFNTQLRQYQLSYEEEYITLLGHINIWEQNYTLVAPDSGNVSLTSYWEENQNVKIGDIVLTIVPNHTSPIVGIMEVPIYGSGKVKNGQKVNIQFDNYPYMEYGTIAGIVQRISLVPSNDKFYLEVSLPNGLKTNINKTLVFKQEMKGTAEIITEDISLLERILTPILSVIKKIL